ncbi:hypothetical protein [Actinocorallia populi]|uniref:hypothetical protein n=1 Tax=Actinocorallia populi TaxID=2079200 RepID=UPI000D097EB3|nr:hypothetical protein [Actinocorallia populi]
MRIAQAVVALVGAGLLSACTFNADLGTGGPTGEPSSRATAQTGVDVPEQQVPLDTRPQARRVAAAEQAGGLVKLTGQGAVSGVVVDPGEMRPDMTLVMENYEVPAQDEPVLVIAVDNVPEETSTRRQHLWRGLLEHIGWTHGNITAEPYEPGKYGGSVECFLASLAETGNVVCGWADENTAGVALIPNSDLATAASVFVAMRDDIEV